MSTMTAPGSDAELVAGVLAGDRQAFAGVYERYADRLHDFAFSLLRSREEAADCVADSFVVLAEKVGQLRDPGSLRPWLYSVVRNECLRTLRGRARLAHDDEWLEAMPDQTSGPEEQVEQEAVQEELRELVWSAAAGLNERDRALLDLHLRQGLDGTELAQAMEVTPANAYVMLSRVRDQVERSLGALLVARRGSKDCTTLVDLLRDWDGRFSPLIRKRVARHIDGCDICDTHRKLMVSPLALLSGTPAVAAPAALRDRVLQDERLVAFYADQDEPQGGGTDGRSLDGRHLVAGLGLILLLLGVVVTLLLVVGGDPDDLQATDTTPGSTAPPTEVETPDGIPPTADGATAPTIGETSPPASDATSDGLTDGPSTEATGTTPGVLAPAALEVSTRSLRLGGASSGTVRLRNVGGRSLDLTATSRTAWLSPSPRSATLAAGAATTLRIAADRTTLGEGSSTGQVAVRWNGRTVLIDVSLTVDRAPVIGAIAVSADTTCDGSGRRVPASAAVTDEPGISSVRVSWSGVGSGQANATRSGSRWSATIGSFPVGGNVTVRFTATDRTGHQAVRSHTFSVDPCPG